jgi:hypothetical protein
MAISFRLTNLPEELISVVASHVSSSADLCHLALASKRLNRITTAHLYRHVSLIFGGEYRNYELLFNLLILLLERPQLAAYVQHLTIRGEWKRDWNAGKALRIDELHPTLQQAIDRLTRERKSKRAWSDNVMGWDREEALFAFLLHTLPNLAVLDTTLKDSGLQGMHYRWLMREVSYRPMRLLNKLQDLVLVMTEPMLYTDMDSHQPWFNLPSLKRVFLYNFYVMDEGQEWENRELYQEHLTAAVERRKSAISPLPQIEHLELRHGFFDFTALCDLVVSCRGLQVFCYDFLSSDMNELRAGFYSLLVSALSTHALTLTTLYFHQNFNDTRTLQHTDALNFRELPNLQHLKVPLQFLLSDAYERLEQTELVASKIAEKLPPGLRKLSVLLDWNPNGSFLAALTCLLKEHAVLCPALAELAVHSSCSETSAKEIYTALRAHATKSGVRLRIYAEGDSNAVGRERRTERNWGIDGDITWAPAAYNTVFFSEEYAYDDQ